MNKPLSESDGSAQGDRRLNRSVSSSTTRAGRGSPIDGQRIRPGTDNEGSERELIKFNDQDGGGRMHQLTRRKKSRPDIVSSGRSMDSGSGSTDADIDSVTAIDVASRDCDGGATGQSGSNSNALKSIWKKAVDKLIKKTKPSDSKESSSTPPEESVAGTVDPVYSFLKLTSVMPRQGTTNVIPGQDHHCCPASKSDANLDYSLLDETAYSTDPSKCQCPCHLPERLEACHHAWKKAFLIDKRRTDLPH